MLYQARRLDIDTLHLSSTRRCIIRVVPLNKGRHKELSLDDITDAGPIPEIGEFQPDFTHGPARSLNHT